MPGPRRRDRRTASSRNPVEVRRLLQRDADTFIAVERRTQASACAAAESGQSGEGAARRWTASRIPAAGGMRRTGRISGRHRLGFGVAINTAKQLLLDTRSFWSGREGEILSNALADVMNLSPKAGGYLIRNVAKNSPGEKMGLRGGTTAATIAGQRIVLGGDILLRVEGVPADSLANLIKIRSLLAS